MGILARLLSRHDAPGQESSTPWVADFRVRGEKFGYANVPASDVYAAFDQVVVPSCSGFAQIKQGLLARQISPDVFHLISFGSDKRGSYCFRWGVSLAYVPHEWGERCRYHRTLKSVRFDLFEDPLEFVVQDWRSAEGWGYMADTLHGPMCFREDLVRAWANLWPIITSWFSAVQDLQGVLNQATQHLRHNWRGARHYPDPKLVLAFTLARVGKREEGAAALNELSQADPTSYGSEGLKTALSEITALQ